MYHLKYGSMLTAEDYMLNWNCDKPVCCEEVLSTLPPSVGLVRHVQLVNSNVHLSSAWNSAAAVHVRNPALARRVS